MTMRQVECRSGWVGLYQPLLDLCEQRGIPVLQVKEKFGGLRFYTGHVSDLDTLIRAAEAFSYNVCEDCGESKVARHVRQDDGSYQTIYTATTGPSRTSAWTRTLCAPCREKWDVSRETR